MNSKENFWISVCVSTYNRADLLAYLYQSIVSQESSDVQLVIVNDGSTDKTEELIQNWIHEEKVKIHYFYQNNEGRGSSLRKALLNAEGEYSIIMDDDDYFVDGAFKRIKQSLLRISEKNSLGKKLAGICGLCISEDGEVLGDKFPNNNYKSDFFKIRFIDNISGDKKEIVKTEIIRRNIFPYFENEKRIVTSTLWNRIAYNYDCLFLNYAVAVKRYIKGGMSDSLLTLKAESPNYQIEDSIISINYPDNYRPRVILMCSAKLWKYWLFGGNLNLSKIKFSRLPLVFFGLPLGIIIYLYDWIKLKYNNNND